MYSFHTLYLYIIFNNIYIHIKIYTYIYIYISHIYIYMNESPHTHYAFAFRILIGMIIWGSFCMFLRYELVLHWGWLLSRLWLTNSCPDFFDVRGNISYVDGSKLSRPKMDGWMVAKNQRPVYPSTTICLVHYPRCTGEILGFQSFFVSQFELQKWPLPMAVISTTNNSLIIPLVLSLLLTIYYSLFY